jgi:hypothetical protein
VVKGALKAVQTASIGGYKAGIEAGVYGSDKQVGSRRSVK